MLPLISGHGPSIATDQLWPWASSFIQVARAWGPMQWMRSLIEDEAALLSPCRGGFGGSQEEGEQEAATSTPLPHLAHTPPSRLLKI